MAAPHSVTDGRQDEGRVGRTVQCVVLKREAEGLERAPYPGELGRRIYDSVSKEGWAQWLRHQTMLINEYRLTPIEPKARKFLEAEMEKFFFGAGSKAPEGYQPPKDG
jgi:Fe-S cluster biosynthesis and repair protein YggX